MNRNTFGMEAQAVDESVNGPKIEKRINTVQNRRHRPSLLLGGRN